MWDKASPAEFRAVVGRITGRESMTPEQGDEFYQMMDTLPTNDARLGVAVIAAIARGLADYLDQHPDE